MNKIKLHMIDRQNKILAEMRRGVHTEKIAAKWGITRARVYQILHAAGWSAKTIESDEQAFPTVAEVSTTGGGWIKEE